ncbi:FG-GAP-like repeat-containing protein [Streptomyces sp. N35]|uniref:FG-GAP-like repeat-containing protein n=1 Tax=Streptomyces sp. N35 TaxID=2795730 RepID=UPI0018F5BAE9|nr:FG-GAP-like repeat-containing protein [Streptomyces sp. N35]
MRIRRHGWRSAAGTVAAAVTGAIGLGLLPGTAAAAELATPGDFNGDGYRDLVLGAPWMTVSGHENAGAVVVVYGAKGGISATKRAVITQNSPGVPGGSETYDGFGSSTDVADLNRDGYADLVVGTPGEDLAEADAGMVSVLWGSRTGLTSGAELKQAAPGSGYFGLDVAAFRGSTAANSMVLGGSWQGTAEYKGPFGRTGSVGNAWLNRETPSIESVALGDLDKNGVPDRVLFSSRIGDGGGQVYVNPVRAEDRHLARGDGLTGAVGDVNGDGYGDLVVGDPEDPSGTDAGAVGGRVSVWFGSAKGIAPDAQPRHISQDTSGVPGGGERGDNFGASVAVADLNRDGAAEIIVGAPGEAIGKVYSAGNVTVIPGVRSGALGAGSYGFSQDTSSVPGGSELEDLFGTTVGAGDLNGDGRPELIVTASGENGHQGAVWMLPGGSARPTGTGSKMFLPSALGIKQSDPVMLGGRGLLDVI